MWNYRNTKLHGENLKDIKQKHHDQLKDHVEQLYKRAQAPSVWNQKDIRQVFKLTCTQRQNTGITALEPWINLATQLFPRKCHISVVDLVYDLEAYNKYPF